MTPSAFNFQHSTLPRYDRYKDSGVEWLGAIPEHWTVSKTRWLWDVIDDRSENGDEQLLSISQYTGVTPTTADSRSESLEGYRRCKPEDLAMNIMLAWQGGLGVSDYEGVVSPAYSVFRLKSDCNAHYLGYLYRTTRYLDEFGRNSTGIVPSRWRLYPDKFGHIFTLLPPKPEQDRIVRFLDEKTAQIDELIAKKQKQIELLDEQKAIRINQAVTKGLNPNAKMKPSGIEWIGEIPEGWTTGKVRHLFDNLDNRRIPLSTIDRGKMTERKYDYYGASGVIDKVEDYLYDEDLLLIAEDGANLVFRNLPLAIIATGKYWVNNHAHILRPKTGPLHYWFHALECTDYSTAITGAAQPKLTKDALASISLPNPPPEEQEEIVEHIQKNDEEERTLRGTVESQIESLKTLRSALIAHAVTGNLKID